MKHITPIIILSICTITWSVETPIHDAIQNNGQKVINQIIKDNIQSIDKANQIIKNSKKSTKEIKKIIKKNKRLINEKSGSTRLAPLHLAAMKGYTDTVKLLLKQPNIDPNIQNYFRGTPLHLASRNGYIEIVKLLLAQPNTDPNTQNFHKFTPLDYAIRDNHLAITTLFIAYKANTSIESLQKLDAFSEINQACNGQIPKIMHHLSVNQALQIMAGYGYNNQIINYIKNHPLPDSATLMADSVMLNNFKLVQNLLKYTREEQQARAFDAVIYFGTPSQAEKFHKMSAQTIAKHKKSLSEQACTQLSKLELQQK